jgi:hypothetical protein
VTEAQQRRARAQFGKIFKVVIHSVRTSLQGVDEHISARAHAKSTARLDPLFHCHILEHEDGGMMAIIRVLLGPALKRSSESQGPADYDSAPRSRDRQSGVTKRGRECEVGFFAAVASSGFEIFADPPSRISYEDSANRLNTLGFPSFSDAIRIWHR